MSIFISVIGIHGGGGGADYTLFENKDVSYRHPLMTPNTLDIPDG